MKKLIMQWAIFSALFLTACVAFMLLAGEDSPTAPLPFGKWIAIKACAAAALFACYKIGKALYKNGYLPEHINKIAEEE